MKIITVIALATLLTGCATVPDDFLGESASRARAPGVQVSTGATAQAGQHESANLR